MSGAKYLGLTANKLARIASDLDAENARLREERCEYQATIDSLVDECADHKAEVARLRAARDTWAENDTRLRELVRRMRDHIKATCGECDGWYCSNFDEDNECCVFDSLTRELGIEVNP